MSRIAEFKDLYKIVGYVHGLELETLVPAVQNISICFSKLLIFTTIFLNVYLRIRNIKH